MMELLRTPFRNSMDAIDASKSENASLEDQLANARPAGKSAGAGMNVMLPLGGIGSRFAKVHACYTPGFDAAADPPFTRFRCRKGTSAPSPSAASWVAR